MNQDQLKLKLDEYTDHKDFQIIFSGKHSKKVDGLYHPEKQEIIIHNKNFSEENGLMYTALHELAHHIDFSDNRGKTTRNAHGGEFRAIFHSLLSKAIEMGDYDEFEDPFLDQVVQFVCIVFFLSGQIGFHPSVEGELLNDLLQLFNFHNTYC